MSRQFLYRLQPIRPQMLVDGPTDEEAKWVQAHFAYLQQLQADGRLWMAGRTTNTDPSSFGLVVFEADSADDAAAVMNADPAVGNGVMTAELFPYAVALWRGQPTAGSEA